MSVAETVRMTQFTGKLLEKSSFSWESALSGAGSIAADPNDLDIS